MKGADGNLVFEQDSCSCRRQAVWTLGARGAQEAISCRCAYGEQLMTALLAEVQVPMPLERFNQGG